MSNAEHRTINFSEIEAELFKCNETGKGMLKLQVIGHSNEGRPLYAVVIGGGDTRIWIQGRIHGDEPYGAEACLDILKTLVACEDKAKQVLNKITFMVIPCYNPDGSEKGWRGNSSGMDLNRQWGHFSIFEEMAKEWAIEVPPILYEDFMKSVESRHYWYAWRDFKPHYFIDYHHEPRNNYCSSDTNEPATLAINTPGNSAFRARQDSEISKRNSQLAIIAYDTVKKLPYCNPTRYPLPERGFPAGMGAGVTVGVPGPKGEDPEWASYCVYFENMPPFNGPLSREHSVEQFVVGGWGVINSIISGELHQADPERFWNQQEVPMMVKCP
jgi:hypothetical protein